MHVKRVLLIITRSSATGHSVSTVERLRPILDSALGSGIDLQVKVVEEHPEVRELAGSFMSSSGAPGFILVGGGGGTLRAVIEGICSGTKPGNLPGPERICISQLRMGSGNIVARQFGIPRDPETGLRGIAANLRENRTAPCCIMRIEAGNRDSPPDVYHAAAMAGFGQFGRSPGDLARWHRRLPTVRRVVAKFTGIERLNNVEYFLSVLCRFPWCSLRPGAAEVIEVNAGDYTRTMRLLAGVVINFPFKQLPFKPELRAEDAALSLHFIPYPGRLATFFWAPLINRLAGNALQITISKSDTIEVRLVNRNSVEFFLDEDPHVFCQRVKIGIAGTLAFVPGPDYQWLQKGRPR